MENTGNIIIIRSKIRILSDDMAQVKAVVEVAGTVGDKLFTDEIKVHINSLYLTTRQRDKMIKLKAIKEFKQIYADYGVREDSSNFTVRYKNYPITYSTKDE